MLINKRKEVILEKDLSIEQEDRFIVIKKGEVKK